MTATQKTLSEALAAIGLTTSYPSTGEMLRALTAAAGKLYSRHAIETNARQDVNAFKAPFSDGDLSLLDPRREAEMLELKRGQWAARAKADAGAVETARAAIAAHVERVMARQRALPSEASKVAHLDKTAQLLARLVDGQERAEAAQFVRERSAADVAKRYANGDEEHDAPFLRYIEDASEGQYLHLGGEPSDAAGVVMGLREQIRERQAARIGHAERDALALLPKVAADVARNLAEIEPTPTTAAGVLKVAGREGLRENPRLVAQAARMAAEAEPQAEARR